MIVVSATHTGKWAIIVMSCDPFGRGGGMIKCDLRVGGVVAAEVVN